MTNKREAINVACNKLTNNMVLANENDDDEMMVMKNRVDDKWQALTIIEYDVQRGHVSIDEEKVTW